MSYTIHSELKNTVGDFWHCGFMTRYKNTSYYIIEMDITTPASHYVGISLPLLHEYIREHKNIFPDAMWVLSSSIYSFFYLKRKHQ